ncbi:MAG: hypothetical protein ACE5JZ_00320 [Kiloniellales bacterium]
MPAAATCQGEVALDLATLAADPTGALKAGLDWPTPYADYGFLSKALVDEVAAGAREGAETPELKAAVEAKLYDMVTDLAVIGRLALDLRHMRESGRRPLYSPADSAWLHFLNQAGTDANGAVGQRAWHHRRAVDRLSELKRRLKRWHSDSRATLTPSAGRFDLLSRNPLMDQYLAVNHARRVDISPNYRDWPPPSETPAPVKGVAAAMTETFSKLAVRATGDDPALRASAEALARAMIADHLAKAWRDLERVRGLFGRRRAGAVLAGGTPKHIGRLIAWRYKELGRAVYRFAHGGERAFYDDYAWGLAELPGCDRYFCHSRAEATHIARRLAEGRMAPAGPADVAFEGLGSQRHRAIRAALEGRKRGPRGGAVMYVAGGYLGEELGDFPARKPPDPLYFEWQAWLLATIRGLGFKMVTKVHPKGVLRQDLLLRPFSDEVLGGTFDAVSHDQADCYLFDFAGTAFFDALASDRGIVLIDMGVRPKDANAFDDLKLRCEVVSCIPGSGNRFRVDTDRLGEAIERAAATRSWPEPFFETYFHG